VLESSYPQGAVDQRDVERRDDVLVYTSDELTSPLEVIGPVKARLVVSSSATCTDFDVTVSDVHPDGRSLKVCDGILRTVVSGEPSSIDVDLGAVGHRFLAGHRVRVRIASSNFPRYDLNPGTGHRWGASESVTATQTLMHEHAHPSFVQLMVV
jgi:uncharacterized protein